MIDWQQVRQLEEDIGIDDFGEVVTLFLAEVDEAIFQLKENPPIKSEEISAALHFLKGSAYNLGFKSFGDFCGIGERHAKNGQLDENGLEEVIDLYQQSKAIFLDQAAGNCSFSAE